MSARADRPAIKYFGMGPWPIYVGFTTSPKAFKREMSRFKIVPPPEFVTSNHANATAHTFEHDGELTVIIAMEDPTDKPVEQTAGLLAHEAAHVAQQLWAFIGEDTPGAEAEAYLVQYITQCCLEEAMATGRTRKVEP